MEGLQFKVGPKSFYQTNSEQAYNLYKVAREFAGLTGNEGVGEDLSSPKDNKPAETAARTPDPNNPETFNFAGITGNEGTAGTETQQPSKTENKTQTPKTGTRIQELRGLGKPTQKPTKVVEMDTNTRNAFVSTHQQKRA